MTALILLEHHFIKGKDKQIYCDRIIDYNYLKRYLNVFDNIILCGRMTEAKETCKDKLLVSGENVDFVALPEFQGIGGLLKNYIKIISIIQNIIPKVNCCIMRAPSHLSLISYRLFKRKKLPFALEFNGAADKFIDNNSILGKLMNKFVFYQTKKMCMSANGVSYVTEYILQNIYPCRAMKEKENKNYFTTSYSSIDLTDNMIYKQNWSEKEKPKIFKIIHTGYMDTYKKGHVTLIKTVREIIDQGYDNIKIILVGDGNKREEFEKMTRELEIENHFEFTGLVKQKKDMTELLKNCHMLVFPTHTEGLPRSVIEAMAVGLVCISSPVGGIPELLDANMMIEYTDFREYAKKVIEFLNDWPKMIEISKKNNLLVEKYKKDILAQKRNVFYTNLKEISKNKISGDINVN